ncbi:peptide ABC transporter substrate-binding protein [Tenuibacillus multivorans]|uniref:Dipeptide transport system substrate-binding protein n=1 Tax=Tenuibacillus multivorans TaxID=237069 RepID=A0A1G9W4D4_9BACI|nr:peptide ABC transporter substrate-binding protein [Tenuibacillus multivorans]GEL78754.1 dipeptide-binding protein DppE [Tenuibacillus multivorans]SDM79066.1 dipeptide transport system substrate-binding protein [Tenuibacillus multivorans]
MKKKWLLCLLTITLALFLVACTTTSSDDDENTTTDDEQTSENEGNESEEEESDSQDDGKKVLYLNNGEEPTSFDPPIGFDSVSWNALNNLLEGLTRLDSSHTPQPAIAEDWEISDDGTVYTFYIREDANWSNGDPVTAQDFVFAWKRLLNPETASSAAFLGYFIKGGEAYNTGEGSADDVMVEAVDDKTFKVTLEAPTGFFLNLITNPAFFPINHQVAQENPEWHSEADSFVANGPFQLKEWNHDNNMVFEKNPEYWDADTVKLDEVHWAMVNDTNTEYQMYESGDLDSSGIPSDLAEQLLEGDDVVYEDQAGTYFYRFNVTEEPFQNEKIRKAFAMAINQEEIVNYITKNLEKPAYGFVSYGFQDANGQDFREQNGDFLTFDPEQAKQLLEEGMAEEGYDELPEITLSYNTSDAHKSIAEYMQQQYIDVLGIEVTLENTEWNVFLQDQKDLNHQFSRSSFLADYADPVNFLESFITDSSMNRTGWSNEEYDQLIANAKNETDPEQRFEYLYEAEKILFDEMPLFPIHFYNQIVLQNPDVTGVVRHPVGYLELKWADKN